ncbi:MAG: hybrid sensor histidine kinase/response regulator [Rhizobiales bacterium PAR1]|nr:MAG: hybrid sensor histidine kinase/response regulator [Rhizobiales bacterium PAR1]
MLLSIRAKLLTLIIVSTLAATSILTGVSVYRDAIRFTEGKRAEIEATAKVFASATADAVRANSQGEALKVLRAVAKIPGILNASIHLPNGRIFAMMGEGVVLVREPMAASGPLALMGLIMQESISVDVPVISGGESIGKLTMVADTSQVAKNAFDSLMTAVLAGAIAMLVGFLLAFRTQRVIVRRISTITETMDHVRLRHDFARRIEGQSNDELDVIAKGFNSMLDEVQFRDSQLAQHRENLEREVADRTQDYRIAKENADAANAAKSDFLATMSHEIRTPMNGILVMAELLAASELQPKQKRFADVIARSGSSLLAIINDILDFSKIEAGKIELETIPVIIDDVVETVAQLFEEKARSKGLDLATHITSNIPARIGADPVRLNQVLSNLVNNALKFTESGSVNIKISRDPERPGNILFGVEDTGIGIPADKLDKVFEAFSQADQTTTRKFGGTGLGLAICKRLVDSMEGEIFVRSTLGVGTTFFFSIPIIHVDRMDTASLPLRHGPGRILLAVSGKATTENLTRYLREQGFEVGDPVNDVLEPGQGDVKLIIAEAGLLGDPGIRPLLKRAPTIAVGTFGDAEIDRVIDQGLAQGQLIKPISRRELSQTIGDVLAGNTVKRTGAQANAVDVAHYPDRLVLVADDNAVNREVIIETLRRFDLPCDTVIDGRAAIEAVKSKHYDMVFMDGSMPDIDGFEATIKIREWEHETGKPQLPIVALTAHVVGAHADAWKRAGMNGVLHKPFTMQAMADTLKSYLVASTRPAIPAAAHVAVAAPAPARIPEVVPVAALPARALPAKVVLNDDPEDPILEPNVTRQLLDMAKMGGQEAVTRIYRLYLENGPPALAEIDASLDAKDSNRLGKAAHALKSMSLSLGAQRVAAGASELEKAARGELEKLYAEQRVTIEAELEQAYARIALLMEAEGLGTAPAQSAVA